jgi:hypothetical protein
MGRREEEEEALHLKGFVHRPLGTRYFHMHVQIGASI